MLRIELYTLLALIKYVISIWYREMTTTTVRLKHAFVFAVSWRACSRFIYKVRTNNNCNDNIRDWNLFRTTSFNWISVFRLVFNLKVCRIRLKIFQKCLYPEFWKLYLRFRVSRRSIQCSKWTIVLTGTN